MAAAAVDAAARWMNDEGGRTHDEQRGSTRSTAAEAEVETSRQE